MPSRRAVELQFPFGGVNKRLAYQSQPPFTTPRALNVRTVDTEESRRRGGSRPGLARAFPVQPNGNNPIDMLLVGRSAGNDSTGSLEEDFEDVVNLGSSPWEKPGWATGLPTVESGVAKGVMDGNVYATVLETPNQFTNKAQYSIHLGKIQIRDDSNILIFLFQPSSLGSTDPRTSGLGDVGGLVLQFSDSSQGQGFSYTAKYNATTIGNTSGSRQPNSITVDVLPSRTVIVKDETGGRIDTIELDKIGLSDASSFFDQTRVGFGFEEQANQTAPISATVGDFSFEYHTSASSPPDAIVVASGGTVYYESAEGVFTAAGGSLTVKSDSYISAVDRLGKVYIADYGERTSGTTGSIVSGVLDEGGVAWAAHGITTADDYAEIISDAGDAGYTGVGVYPISTIDNDAGLTLTGFTAGNSTGNISWRVCRAPKVLDIDTGVLSLLSDSTAGSPPLNCRCVEVYRDRLVWTSDDGNPGVWYASRQGGPTDYDYSTPTETDVQRAFAGTSTDTETGGLALPVTAVAAGSDDYLMLSAASELFVMRGDPALGGSLDNLSRQVGISSCSSWCRTPEGLIVFLSRDGLYSIHPRSTGPERLSKEKLPRELLGLGENLNYDVFLEYDVDEDGIHIIASHRTNKSAPHYSYFYDWNSQAFWPNRYDNANHHARSMMFMAKINKVLWGGRDGWIRAHQQGSSDDDGTEVATEVLYGPLSPFRSAGRQSVLQTLRVSLDDVSGDVSLKVYAGVHPEAAVSAEQAKFTRVIGSGFSVVPVKISAMSILVGLEGVDGSKWAVDSIVGEFTAGGLHRE